jgi:hypothetical protein
MILQIRIELEGIEPRIWRRIQIDGACTFWDLHVAIQDAMGWTDCHLHLFRVDDPQTGQTRQIGLHLEDDLIDDEDTIEPGWEHQVTDLLSVARSRAVYIYDFGDSWEHGVVLEDELPGDGGSYPRCVVGARRCPPEDVGGPPGYENFLKAIGDPRHEDHAQYLTWVGGAFDQEAFDADQIVFQDPRQRWQEVFADDDDSPSVPRAIQIEGGFTKEEILQLLEDPFGDASRLQWATDLPDEVFEGAPLLVSMRQFLRVLAEAEPWKLTQTGNLSRAMLTRLTEAGALGETWWREDRPARNEVDLPRATLLRGMAELAGLTRKAKGKLHLTRRGREVADGKMRSDELYRLLMARYVTKFNWSFEDPMPASSWLQAGFWYVVYLLQQYGSEKRPSTFYAERYAMAFPWLQEEFAGYRYATPQELLERVVDQRVFVGFAAEFGLARTFREENAWREPHQVWAGPLLEVITLLARI